MSGKRANKICSHFWRKILLLEELKNFIFGTKCKINSLYVFMWMYSEQQKVLSHVQLFVTVQSMEFLRPEHWNGQPFPSPEDLPNPGIKPRSPTLQVDSLSAEPQEKPKNTGVGSLSLLQRIFLTQKLNWALLHGRWILYQLSYQESYHGISGI